jgi:hypothetical protein
MTPEEIRRTALYLDGLRYSLSMADIAASRLQLTLDEIARLHDAKQDAEEQVSSALLDAWSLIDMCHRARELVQGTPTLHHKLHGIQLFLRTTSDIEDLRHYVQHFRSGIPDVPASWSPLWGSISWVPEYDPTTCYTIFTGNLVEGLTASSISYDTHESRFTTEIILSTGIATADLRSIAERMRSLRISLVEWLDQHPTFTHRTANTLIWTMSISPHLHEPNVA